LPGGVRSPDDLWRLLVDGRDAITNVPAERWDGEALFDADPGAANRIHSRCGGFLDGVDRFDAAFFGISPREAAQMDPQQRLLLVAQRVGLDSHSSTGSAHSILANRLSYTFDLRGPSMGVDTACSSSLVAVHQACQSLRTGECDLALAGGVNLMLLPSASLAFSKLEILSAEGRCRTFDARANGIVRGEGVALVVLKRLADAVRDGDPVL